MNFPSYARTVWRHNRDTNFCTSRGRLLLNLTDCEMTLKDESLDGEFLVLFARGNVRIILPRTQLLTLERIAQSRHVDACKYSEFCGHILWKTLESTLFRVVLV